MVALAMMFCSSGGAVSRQATNEIRTKETSDNGGTQDIWNEHNSSFNQSFLLDSLICICDLRRGSVLLLGIIDIFYINCSPFYYKNITTNTMKTTNKATIHIFKKIFLESL